MMCKTAGTALWLTCIVAVHSFQTGWRRLEPSRLYPSVRVCSTVEDAEIMANEAFERTAAHLEKLKGQQRPYQPSAPLESSGITQMGIDKENLRREYLQRSANSLKEELKKLKLPRNGRKPHLAERLAEYEVQKLYGKQSEENRAMEEVQASWVDSQAPGEYLSTFAGLRLSMAAGAALGKAGFATPSPVQRAAIPALFRGESAILHAETGSGKTLAYLLPVTERIWEEVGTDEYEDRGYCVIMTPTRELAAQVAGIAQVLAPPGSVRLLFQPTNLMKRSPRERGEAEFGGINLDNETREDPRIFVGSAKTIMFSLFGDGKMPAAPTPKPEAKYFLRKVRWLVLDEVDRILHVKKTRSEERYRRHERPAAVVTSSVARQTLGQAQIICASATVGRPLKRELCRVLGLAADECPVVIRGRDVDKIVEGNNNDDEAGEERIHQGRAVTIPSTVENFVTTIEGTSSGTLLTKAFEVIKVLASKPRKILLVVTKACGISTQNTVGALRFFGCKPEPKSLLDALEADGTDRMIEKHRQVSGATGIGETGYFTSDTEDDGEYILVTGEDTVRGLHLDGLDVVIIVGRPRGPDEYTHIAGRTGRAGKRGKAFTIVSEENSMALKSWERMLETTFTTVEVEDIE